MTYLFQKLMLKLRTKAVDSLGVKWLPSQRPENTEAPIWKPLTVLLQPTLTPWKVPFYLGMKISESVKTPFLKFIIQGMQF